MVSWSSSPSSQARRGVRVDAHPLHHRRLRGATAQQRTHPGEQLGEPERLGDVVVRARVEPDHGVDLVGPGGQDQHRHAVALGADAAAHFEPVQVGQADVENDQVDAAAERTVKRVRSIGRDVDEVPLTPECAGERLGN